VSFEVLDRVALIDDDDAFRSALAERLELEGLAVIAFGSAEAALKVVNDRFDGVVVTDLRMPGMDGRQLVERLNGLDPDLPVVMMTGHGDIAEAVDAMKRGAYDFLAKPFAPERLIETLGRALEKRALVLDNRRLAALAEDDEGSRGWFISPERLEPPGGGASRGDPAARRRRGRRPDRGRDRLREGGRGACDPQRRSPAFAAIRCGVMRRAARDRPGKPADG